MQSDTEAAWKRLSVDDKVKGAAGALGRALNALSGDCMQMLNKLTMGDDASYIDGRTPSPITRQGLADKLRNATFHNLNTQGDVATAQTYRHLDAEFRAKAERDFAGRTILGDLGRNGGFGADYFGSTLYYTSSVGGFLGTAQEHVEELATTLLHETLHLIGFGHSEMNQAFSFNDLKETCVKPLGLTP
ncbi:MAG: hypothetical protein R2729_32505 [Bryobacteraceae bacterium]